MTSEKMNQNMPMRKDLSTCSLYRPPWLSPMTVPNQPISMKTMTATPVIITQKPASAPFSQLDTPTMSNSRPSEPTIGQWLPWGT